MKKHIFTIIFGAMIACSLSSCSKDADDIKVDQVELNVSTQDVKTQVANYKDVTIYSSKTQTLGIIKGQSDYVYLFSNKDATFQSSNEKICTVDKYGHVFYKSDGNAEITVTIGEKITEKIPVCCYSPTISINGNVLEVSYVHFYGPNEINLDFQGGGYLDINYSTDGKISSFWFYNNDIYLSIDDSEKLINSSVTNDNKTGSVKIVIDCEDDDNILKVNTTVINNGCKYDYFSDYMENKVVMPY